MKKTQRPPFIPAKERFQLIARGWNVSLAKHLTAGRGTQMIQVAEWVEAYLLPCPRIEEPMEGGGVRIRQGWVHINTTHALSTTCNYEDPPIVAVFKGTEGEPLTMIIDGWHRMYRAWVAGQRVIPVRVLTDQETKWCELF